MNRIVSPLVAAAVSCAVAAPALAHHSFAMFDPQQTYTVASVVTDFQWSNPHCWLEIDVPDGKGAHKNYKHLSLELTALGGLRGSGWGPHTLNPGDKVEVTYHPMRDGSAAGQLITVKLHDGAVLKGQ